jgi:phosphatidylglycerol:prolipoprotein diacylglycerol transferase
MCPELFEIPFIHVTIKSFGFMIVIGFLAGGWLVGRLSRSITSESQHTTNVALYALMAGVIGARLFFVIHYFESFRAHPLEILYIWRGGLEFYGGVVFAIPVIIFYLRRHKLPIRRSFDILAIGLMLGVGFGRLGCFMNSCCYGKPTELPWAIRFPYNSYPYVSQINPDPDRNRPNAQLDLPPEQYLDFTGQDGKWYPKPYEDLTEEQKNAVSHGEFRCLTIHPTQLYSSANGFLLCLILYFFWRRSQKAAANNIVKPLAQPGQTFALAFMLYGVSRFLIEFIRDDNPFEYAWWAIYKGGTVSQNVSIYLIILGVVLMVLFQRLKPKTLQS